MKSTDHGSDSGTEIDERAAPWTLWRAWLFLAVASFALWCVIGAGVLALL